MVDRQVRLPGRAFCRYRSRYSDVAVERGNVKQRAACREHGCKPVSDGEERAVAKVVADFRAALPDAAIYVYDNNSTDRTVEAALRAGAVVRRESYHGKGHVVRPMFNDVEADVYVLVDGDGPTTHPARAA
jgi:hypothetical protein